MTIADRIDLGFFPLQDHAAGLDDVPVSIRLSLAGARISKLQTSGTNAADSIAEYAREHGLGTLGDIHPWAFWQTRDRAVRGSGLWTQSLGVLVTSADAIYGTNETSPLRDSRWLTDTRLRPQAIGWPQGLPTLARGSLLIALPGTEESEQHVLGYWADPRLIAPNAAGPGEAGTIVCDLGPANEICMSDSSTPGIGGRHARLQSLVRVVAVGSGGFGGLGAGANVLALNYTTSQQDNIAGHGAVFGRLSGGGGTTTRQAGGTTEFVERSTAGIADQAAGATARSGDMAIGAGAFGAGLGSDLTADGEPQSKTPRAFGSFTRSPRGGHGLGVMAAVLGYGPIHLGSAGDKHQHGADADGHPINAAHISTNAYYFRDQTFDAPLHFENHYPGASSFPLRALTHLSYDGAATHQFASGSRQGLWRWWTEVPFYAPTTDNPPPPTRPTTGGGPRPPGGGPGGPTTPGGGPPAPGAPGTGGGPRPGKGGKGKQPGPTTPGSGGTGDDGPPKGKPQGEPRRPDYPFNRPYPWPLPGDQDPPGDPTRPTGPSTPKATPGGGGTSPDDPGQPDGPGNGPTGPTGPTTPRGGLCGDVPAESDPNRPSDELRAPLPTTNQLFGELVPAHSVLYGGPGGGGTRAQDPRLVLGRLSGRDPYTHQERRIPGLVERVGGADRDSVGLYSIFHPLHETFAAVSFRPQLTVQGAPNFEHNPQLPPVLIERDEAVRPQVLTMRAFGGVSAATGDWAYVEAPASSRARGGTANGGVLFAPPRFEAEDYFGINSGANVDDTSSDRATSSYVLAAPGVAFALGLPTIGGDLAANSVVIRQDVATSTRPMVVEHNAVELLRGYVDGSETLVELAGTTAVLIPSGTDAQRPATPAVGHLRINTESTPVIEWWDGSAWAVPTGISGSPDIVYSDAPGTAQSPTASITLFSETRTIADGDVLEIDITGLLFNDSGAGRTYTWTITLGAMTLKLAETVATPASGSASAPFRLRAVFGIKDTNEAWGSAELKRCDSMASGSNGDTVTDGSNLMLWASSASDLTGSKTLAVALLSSSSSGTQTCTVTTQRLTHTPQRT